MGFDDSLSVASSGPADPPGFEWVAQRMPGAIYRCAVDTDLTMVALTDRFESITGYPADGLIHGRARSFLSVIHPDDRAAVVAGVREVVELGTPAELEYRVVDASGSERWLRQQVWPTSESGFVEGFLFDATERRRQQRFDAEVQITHARQQRCLFELATHPAVADGQFEQLSQVATERIAELIGVERASVWLLDEAGECLELVDLWTRSSATHAGGISLSAHEYPRYFEALRTGRSIDAHDAENDPRTSEFAGHYLQPQGIVAMLDATVRVAGRVAGVLCLEQVGPSRRWSKLEIDFAGEIADQLSMALLNRARIEAQIEHEELRAQLVQSQKMEALGRLAGGVAHDFNNLLMAISGNAELLVLSLQDSELRRSADEIVDATIRAGELTSQLLRFARREPLELRTINLGDAVRKLDDLIRRLLDPRLRFEVRIPPEPMFVLATETLVQQVLTNLVVNARDAVGDHGSITVEIDSIDPTDSSDPGDSGDYSAGTREPSDPPLPRFARLRVTDDGSGMDPELCAKVFEPFFTTKPAGQGTGLGLATVYSIVQRCGGTVEIDSEPGRGTVVSVLLPRTGR